MSIYFITGTDTDVGKTYAACFLLQQHLARGETTYGLKPVGAGSNDGMQLQQAASIKLPSEIITPYALRTPISPHLAASLENTPLSAPLIAERILNTIAEYPADFIVIEGAGGWLAPINDTETLADVAIRLNFPVMLVVGIKLGCLNHAQLTYQAITQSGLNCEGWIANCLDPNMSYIAENIAFLQQKMAAPLRATIPYTKEPTYVP